ncbi:hypothetical protein [Paraburkholderia phenazinium]|uniref:Uncharacterized protein n=1 Tax=Paraburkholderia phenazinium TaxID=60549 RepID=A0A1G7S194_9BURK|nr:hypothetical protein [Paraburkholderia phenazinium]SDG16777.1 hypothetical protein SAMN05216466_102345 [Paraburkholderia phenazinium]
MKGFGYHPHRTLDEAAESEAGPFEDPHRISVKQVATVLLVGAILACIHREISGAADGSLASLITGYARGTLHHLVTLVASHGP